jgi:hypothetical protein
MLGQQQDGHNIDSDNDDDDDVSQLAITRLGSFLN